MKRQTKIIFWGISIVTFAWLTIQPATASIYSGESKVRNAVYHVKTAEGKRAVLADVKEAMDSIAEHIETLKEQDHLVIYIVVHGENIKFLEKSRIDFELSAKIQRFILKGINFDVCSVCLEELGISVGSLIPGMNVATLHGKAS